MDELHLHERINKALTILDSLKFNGYHEITSIGPGVGLAMKELILLEQDIITYEQKIKKEEEAKQE